MDLAHFTFIDLFAGIGGFHHALQSLGGRCVLACEFDPDCRKIYDSSFLSKSDLPFVANIREITRRDISDESSTRDSSEIDQLVPNHDILCAGFPCQPFSKSGWQKGTRDRTRGTLFFDILEIIRAKKPSFLFLENVRNLAGPRHQETWKTIIQSLYEEGYQVPERPLVFSPHLLSPKMGGAPQVRDRVFIFGIRRDLDSEPLEKIERTETLLRTKQVWDPDNWNIIDYLDDDVGIHNIEKYYISPDEEMYLEAWNHFVENIPTDTLPGFPIWAFALTQGPVIEEDMAVWEKDFRKKNCHFYNTHRDFIDSWLSLRWGFKNIGVLDFPYSRQKFEWQARKKHPDRRGRTIKDLVVQFRPSGIRVKPPTYLPALVAITQTSVVGPRLRGDATHFRKLTPLEASRLQGLPGSIYANSVVDDGVAYRQLGNAVNVGIIRYMASLLLGLNSPTDTTGLIQMRLDFNQAP